MENVKDKINFGNAYNNIIFLSMLYDGDMELSKLNIKNKYIPLKTTDLYFMFRKRDNVFDLNRLWYRNMLLNLWK